MNLYDFFTWMSKCDLFPTTAITPFNIFSTAVTGILLIYTFFKMLRIFNTTIYEFRLPVIFFSGVTSVVCFAFFWLLMDLGAQLTHTFVQLFMLSLWLGLDVSLYILFLQAFFGQMCVFVVSLLYVRRYIPSLLDKRKISLLFAITVAFNECTWLVFSINNMRLIDQSFRTIYYVTVFLPLWIYWGLGYYWLWKDISVVENV